MGSISFLFHSPCHVGPYLLFHFNWRKMAMMFPTACRNRCGCGPLWAPQRCNIVDTWLNSAPSKTTTLLILLILLAMSCCSNLIDIYRYVSFDVDRRRLDWLTDGTDVAGPMLTQRLDSWLCFNRNDLIVFATGGSHGNAAMAPLAWNPRRQFSSVLNSYCSMTSKSIFTSSSSSLTLC